MKYSTSEAMNEVLARRDRIRRKRERRRTVWYGVSVCAILIVLTLTSLRTGVGPNGGMGGGSPVRRPWAPFCWRQSPVASWLP